MKRTYLKCVHGNLIGSFMPCKDCEERKQENLNLLSGVHNSISDSMRQLHPKKGTKIPVYRGCSNFGGACYCTGKCKEIIGYDEY